jgi:TRAP-type transport system periplasmic protein
VRQLNQSMQGELTRRGMVFNQTDTEKFRATLRSAGFYADWKQKYGPQAWAALEKQVGSLS